MSLFEDALGLPKRERPVPLKIVEGTYIGPRAWKVVHPGFDPPGTISGGSWKLTDQSPAKANVNIIVPVTAMRPEDV